MPEANKLQVGGKHYAAEYQHWDLVADTGMNYFEGQITKYVARWHSKNGVQDLLKAQHFLTKLQELYGQARLFRVEPTNPQRVNWKHCFARYLQHNKLGPVEQRIFTRVALYAYPLELDQLHSMLQTLIVEAAEANTCETHKLQRPCALCAAHHVT